MKRAGDMRGQRGRPQGSPLHDVVGRLLFSCQIPSIFAKLCLSEYDSIIVKEYMLYAGPASIKNRDHLQGTSFVSIHPVAVVSGQRRVKKDDC